MSVHRRPADEADPLSSHEANGGIQPMPGVVEWLVPGTPILSAIVLVTRTADPVAATRCLEVWPAFLEAARELLRLHAEGRCQAWYCYVVDVDQLGASDLWHPKVNLGSYNSPVVLHCNSRDVVPMRRDLITREAIVQRALNWNQEAYDFVHY